MLLKQEKYYEDVMAAYLDYFQGKEIQFPQWRLDNQEPPRFAINLLTGDNIRLTRKQGLFVRLFYDHFCQSRIGDEWLWFSEAYNMLDEDIANPEWNGLSDIFEGEEKRLINCLMLNPKVAKGITGLKQSHKQKSLREEAYNDLRIKWTSTL